MLHEKELLLEKILEIILEISISTTGLKMIMIKDKAEKGG